MVLLTEVNVVDDWLIVIVLELRTVLKLVAAIVVVTFVVELELFVVVTLTVWLLVYRVLVITGVNVVDMVKLEAFLVVELIGNVPVVNGNVTFETFLVGKAVTVPEIVLLKMCGVLVKLTANGVVVIKVELEAFLVVKLIGNVPEVNGL